MPFFFVLYVSASITPAFSLAGNLATEPILGSRMSTASFRFSFFSNLLLAGSIASASSFAGCANASRTNDSDQAEPDAARRGGVASWADTFDDAQEVTSDAGGELGWIADSGQRDPDSGSPEPAPNRDAWAADGSVPDDVVEAELTCESDADCERGAGCFRVVSGQPGTCLDRCSLDTDCIAGADCVLLASTGVDAERFCVSRPTTSCAPCSTSAQCGGGLCVGLQDGDFCAPVCSSDADCLSNEVCEAASDGVVATDVCVPRRGFCSTCLDLDGDLHGVGECLGDDCDDTNGLMHASAVELCDGFDNDCDGDVDEGFDLLNDPRHCGRCGNACLEPGDGASIDCAAGTCTITDCPSGFVDANGLPADGCEQPLNACGGTAVIAHAPGDSCGECGQTWVCEGSNTVICGGATSAANACGGCSELAAAIGSACGYRDSGSVVCDGRERTRCEGELVAMVVGDTVELNPAYWRLNNGSYVRDVLARDALVARVMGAPTTWHNAELPVTELNEQGWIVFRFPRPFVAGLAPFMEHANCRGTGVEGLPFRFTFRDASLPASDGGSWLFIDVLELHDGGLVYIGQGDDGGPSYTLAASRLDGAWRATGRRLSGDTPDACAYDREP